MTPSFPWTRLFLLCLKIKNKTWHFPPGSCLFLFCFNKIRKHVDFYYFKFLDHVRNDFFECVVLDSRREGSVSLHGGPLYVVILPGKTHGTTRSSELTSHYTCSLVLNLVPGIVSGTKRDCTCTTCVFC